MVNSEFRIVSHRCGAGFCLVVGCLLAHLAYAVEVPVGVARPGHPMTESKGGLQLAWWSPNLEPLDFKTRPPFLAPSNSRIISQGKTVTASARPLSGNLEQITDGDRETKDESVVTLPEGIQWVQVDLGRSFTLHAILLWHFHCGTRVYMDVIGMVSDDPEFETGVTTIYNNDYDNSTGLGKGKDNEYVEQYQGRLFDLKGIRGRYVRFYGRGSSHASENLFVEIEVWGAKYPSRTDAKLEPIAIELPEPCYGGLPL